MKVLKYPVFWGVAATLLVVAFGFCVGMHQTCTEAAGCQSNFEKFLNSPPNEIGDTLAGFAGALAFVWIIVTVWLQSQELSEQRKVLSDQRDEFEKTNDNMIAQRFEVSFFEIISTLNGIVESIDLANNGQVTAKGRDCFRIYYERLVKKNDKFENTKDFDTINSEFWLQYGHEFGHYFRFLYNALRVVSESKQAEEKHGKLLRSMLSNHELLLIFYNCLHPNGENLLRYAVEFELFDNLPIDSLISQEHFKLVPIETFGNKFSDSGQP